MNGHFVRQYGFSFFRNISAEHQSYSGERKIAVKVHFLQKCSFNDLPPSRGPWAEFRLFEWLRLPWLPSRQSPALYHRGWGAAINGNRRRSIMESQKRDSNALPSITENHIFLAKRYKGAHHSVPYWIQIKIHLSDYCRPFWPNEAHPAEIKVAPAK